MIVSPLLNEQIINYSLFSLQYKIKQIPDLWSAAKQLASDRIVFVYALLSVSILC